MLDYYSVMLADFDKIAFIKLEMLSRAKQRLILKKPKVEGERGRGNIRPVRRDDQYYCDSAGNPHLGAYPAA